MKLQFNHPKHAQLLATYAESIARHAESLAKTLHATANLSPLWPTTTDATPLWRTLDAILDDVRELQNGLAHARVEEPKR